MTDLYSIIFHPLDYSIGYIEDCKVDLRLRTYNFASQNSQAHITVAEFEATSNQILGVKEHLKKIVKTQVPFKASFNSFVSSPKTKCAVFLPSSFFDTRIHEITKKTRSKLSNYNLSPISRPHVSVGRKLSDEQLLIAHQLFNNRSFEFDCCRLALRKFNPKINQFEIVEIFTFSGKPSQDGSQQLPLDFNC